MRDTTHMVGSQVQLLAKKRENTPQRVKITYAYSCEALATPTVGEAKTSFSKDSRKQNKAKTYTQN